MVVVLMVRGVSTKRPRADGGDAYGLNTDDGTEPVQDGY